jgi:hypothetical protein
MLKFHVIYYNHIFCSFSLLVQRKQNQKKRRFFLGIFSLKAKNHKEFTKFFPRLQKFLTETPCYTGEKKEKTYRNYVNPNTILEK